MDVGKSPNIPYVYVHHQGEVQNYKPLQVVTACILDIYNFPFDVQNCSLTFTSWLHTSEYVRLWVGQRLGLSGTRGQEDSLTHPPLTKTLLIFSLLLFPSASFLHLSCSFVVLGI